MTYNKSEIMKSAHELYNAGGLTQSEALRKAWTVAKITVLEAQQFVLEQKNRWDDKDRNENFRLTNEISSLQEHGKSSAEKEADRKTEEEKAIAKAQAEVEFYASIDMVWSDADNAWVSTWETKEQGAA